MHCFRVFTYHTVSVSASSMSVPFVLSCIYLYCICFSASRRRSQVKPVSTDFFGLFHFFRGRVLCPLTDLTHHNICTFFETRVSGCSLFFVIRLMSVGFFLQKMSNIVLIEKLNVRYFLCLFFLSNLMVLTQPIVGGREQQKCLFVFVWCLLNNQTISSFSIIG